MSDRSLTSSLDLSEAISKLCYAKSTTDRFIEYILFINLYVNMYKVFVIYLEVFLKEILIIIVFCSQVSITSHLNDNHMNMFLILLYTSVSTIYVYVYNQPKHEFIHLIINSLQYSLHFVNY